MFGILFILQDFSAFKYFLTHVFIHMGSNLIVIFFRYIASKCICMYLVYMYSKSFLHLSHLTHHSQTDMVSQYMYHSIYINIYVSSMYLVWFTNVWDTYKSFSPSSPISPLSLFMYLLQKYMYLKIRYINNSKVIVRYILSI